MMNYYRRIKANSHDIGIDQIANCGNVNVNEIIGFSYQTKQIHELNIQIEVIFASKTKLKSDASTNNAD